MPAFLVHFASLFALALWVGGGAAISFVAAPALFEHAGSRQLAGDLVGRILRRFDTVGLVAGSVALAAVGIEVLGTVGGARTLTLKLALVAGMLGLSLYSRFAVAPEIRKLREAMGNVDQVPKEDPRRQAFGRLHGISVLLLMAQMLLGALAIALGVMTLTARVG